MAFRNARVSISVGKKDGGKKKQCNKIIKPVSWAPKFLAIKKQNLKS